VERALELKRSGRLDQAVIALEARRALPAGRLGRHRDAGRAYEEADALGDRDPWTLAQLARCRLRANDLDGARDAAARAVERDGTSASGHVVLGEVAARAGDLAQAEERFERARELAPDDQYAYARLIEMRLLQLSPEDRARELEVLLRSSGRENRFLAATLARVRSQQGDEEAAAAAWRSSAGGDRDLFARAQEGYALRRAGRLDEAAVVLRDVLLEDPSDVILFRTYVSLQRQLGRLDELQRTLQELLPIAGPRRGAVYGELRKLQTS